MTATTELDERALAAALNAYGVDAVVNGLEAAIRAYLEAAPSPSPAPGVVEALRMAVAVLVAKLDGIHNDPDYKRVWEIAQLHGGPYAGPNYVNELAELRSCLSSARMSSVTGLRYRPLEFDDWGIIRNANDDGIFAVVRRPISEEEAAQCRANKTDPFEPLARSLIASLSQPAKGEREGGGL